MRCAGGSWMTDGLIMADWPAPENVVAVNGTVLRGGDIADADLPGDPCWLKQVHGADVVEAGAFGSPPDADGAVSRRAANVCVVKTADCLPVLLCATDGRTVAGAHAGWRGLAAGVVENTVAKMAVDPREILAWFGPAISQPAFEVGGEVREAFVARHAESASCFETNDRGRWQADLYGLARLRLAVAGVVNVYGGGLCTFSDERRFYSYRRDPGRGRLVSFVGLKPP